MSKQDYWDEFWENISEDDKPEVLEMFYSDMTDAQKDEFLKLTGNN